MPSRRLGGACWIFCTAMPISQIPTSHFLFSAFFGLLLLAFVVELIRRSRLQERYAALWILLALGCMTYGWWIAPVDALSHRLQMGGGVPIVLFLGIFICLSLLLQLSLKISEFSNKIKNLIQETATLKYELSRRKSEPSEAAVHEDA